MSDDERDEDDLGEGKPEAPSEDTGDIPPPSTWAGKSRQDPPPADASDGSDDELSDEISDADEQEEPPTEFDFDDEEDEDFLDDEEELAAAAGEDTPEVTENDPALTREADTLALADIEEAKEKAHAGLTARAGKSSFSQERTTGSHTPVPKPTPKPKPKPKPAPVAAAVVAGDEGVGRPPKRRMWWRFFAASFVIVASMATATAVSFLLFLSDIAEGLNDDNISGVELEDVEGGGPQTILVLGSDKRSGTPGDPGRSDTAILLRVDPEKNFLSLMSLPRDLEVPIPGYGSDKINAAYFYGERDNPGGGGTELMIKTIDDYLDIPINHVVNVDFEGFYEAVNAIDCVYIDVDRDYEHSNEGLFGDQLYAEIDVNAGYQKLCGYKALQYVRYRHGDNDLVRGSRQQDFIREARQRIPPRQLLPVFGQGDELIDIFTKNTSSDINDVPTIIEMLKTFVEVRRAPVRQVSVGELADDGGVQASPEEVKAAVNQFLGNDLEAVPEEPVEVTEEPGGSGGDKKKPGSPGSVDEPALIDSTGSGQQYGAEFEKFMKSKKAKLPIYYPSQIVANSAAAISGDSRTGALPGNDDKPIYYMYKYVMPLQEDFGLSYYGLSGTNWDDPPILENPSEYRTIDGREYMLYFERDRLRLVGWKTSNGSYWVNNTLTHALTEDQMLGVATSTRVLGD